MAAVLALPRTGLIGALVPLVAWGMAYATVPAVMTCGGVAAAVAGLVILGAGRRAPDRAFR